MKVDLGLAYNWAGGGVGRVAAFYEPAGLTKPSGHTGSVHYKDWKCIRITVTWVEMEWVFG